MDLDPCNIQLDHLLLRQTKFHFYNQQFLYESQYPVLLLISYFNHLQNQGPYGSGQSGPLQHTAGPSPSKTNQTSSL